MRRDKRCAKISGERRKAGCRDKRGGGGDKRGVEISVVSR